MFENFSIFIYFIVFGFASFVILFNYSRSRKSLIQSKKVLNDLKHVLADVEINADKIKYFDEMRRCAMDTDNLTVTIQFSSYDELEHFVQNHNGTNPLLLIDQKTKTVNV